MAEKTEVIMLKCKHSSVNTDGRTLVNPEELICAIFAKLLSDKVSLKVSLCDESLLAESDA